VNDAGSVAGGGSVWARSGVAVTVLEDEWDDEGGCWCAVEGNAADSRVGGGGEGEVSLWSGLAILRPPSV
jgi:hypothetical protein